MQIKIPYTTRPTMSRLTSGPVFISNPNTKVLEQKRQELDVLDGHLWGMMPNSQPLIAQACRKTGRPEVDHIKDFALTFQEDVAILHRGVLQAVCFCFPSSWNPSSMVGKSLVTIHAGVADGDHLRAQSDKISKTICDPVLGSFERWVWTVTVSPHLSNHPLRKVSKEPQSIADLYFRLEHQTTLPLDDGSTCVFFVDVSVTPLVDVWSEIGDDLQSSIATMTPAVLEYKNLVRVREILCNSENETGVVDKQLIEE